MTKSRRVDSLFRKEELLESVIFYCVSDVMCTYLRYSGEPSLKCTATNDDDQRKSPLHSGDQCDYLNAPRLLIVSASNCLSRSQYFMSELLLESNEQCMI